MHNQTPKIAGFSWVGFLLFLTICGLLAVFYMTKINVAMPNQQAMQAPPPSEVQYVSIAPEMARKWTSFSGRLAAVEEADIKPQIDGEIIQINFEDGQVVEKGDTLFVIDPRPYQAAVKRIQAQLTSANSRAKLAKDELVRAERLVKNSLVSESVYDTAKKEDEVAKAAINEIQSALVEAKINLEYCYVKAPFKGKVSRAELTVGNIVQTMTGAPTLTTLIATDKLYAEFDVDEQTYIQTVKGVPDIQSMPVKMRLTHNQSDVYEGHIYSFDNQLNASSGTIRARAVFDNPNNHLLPGMFVSVELGRPDEQSMLLLSEKAISTNQSQKYVLVVGEDNTAQYRPVVLGQNVGEKREIKAGLQAGEKVIINGLSHTRPGSPVNATPYTEQAS